MTRKLGTKLRSFALNRITLVQLRDWLFDYTLDRANVPLEDREPAGVVENALAEFSGSHIDEHEVRRAVYEVLAPVVLHVHDAEPRPAR